MEDVLFVSTYISVYCKISILVNRDFNDIKIYSLCDTFDKALINFHQ